MSMEEEWSSRQYYFLNLRIRGLYRVRTLVGETNVFRRVVQRPNSRTYYLVEESGHNLESYQT
jgi:hypothetical protein